MPPAFDLPALAEGVRTGDRASLGRAITLVESTKPPHRAQAQDLLALLAAEPPRAASHRIGITGVPGVGKSTFIDELGSQLTAAGHRVAVLAVDPSSTRTGGSILGDKTRMARLAVDPSAFIRPSPTAGTLGGVTRRTRDTTQIVEAAGYDIVLIETVGVGQSETVVADMVDVFLVLMLPGAGDELQGIKKGILELADIIAVNKADGDNAARARHSASDYSAALRLLQPTSPHWNPVVVTCSALHGEGVAEVWEQLQLHRRKLEQAGAFDERRVEQRLRWMWSAFDEALTDAGRRHPAVRAAADDVERSVRDGVEPAVRGAARLVELARQPVDKAGEQ